MHVTSSKLRTIASSTAIALVSCLIFSFTPTLSAGSLSGVHIDISLLYIVCAITIAANTGLLFTYRHTLKKSPAILLLIALLTYIATTVLWSSNLGRATITAGFFLLVGALSCVFALHRQSLLLQHGLLLRKLLIASYGLAACVALIQITGDAAGIPPSLLLLPDMYTGDVFGIARPTGFSLEPQFFASLLLIPFGYFSIRVMRQGANIYHYISFIATVTLLLLTLSRGAFVAMLVIGIVTLLVNWQRLRLKAVTLYILAAALSLIIMLAIVYSAATVRNDAISGGQAVKGVVEHISLGTISLAAKDTQTAPNTTTTTATVTKPSPHTTEQSKPGYVPSSTESRISMTSRALAIWQQSPLTILFGVGIGSFGMHLNPANPGAVVNNYYAELLAETGLIGLLLFACLIALLFKHLIRHKQWTLCTVLAGLLSQMFFFSGNANIIHLWVIIGLALSYSIPVKIPKIT